MTPRASAAEMMRRRSVPWGSMTAMAARGYLDAGERGRNTYARMRPVLFYLPLGLPIYSYGVMLGLSLVVGWYITLGLCVKDGMDRELMGRCYVWTAVSAVVGS